MSSITHPDWNLRTLCTHEAGHCVMLLHTASRGVFSVRVYPKGQTVGRRRIGGSCTHGEPLLADPRQQALADLLVCCAGRAAERVLLDCEPPWVTFSDGPEAMRLSRLLAGTKEAAERLCIEEYRQAVEVLARPDRWPLVTAIAEELQVRHRLTGKDVCAITRRVLG
jgi:hypothetical protein